MEWGTYGLVSEGLPREVELVNVGRHGDDKVEGVFVDDAFPNVVQLGRQTCFFFPGEDKQID